MDFLGPLVSWLTVKIQGFLLFLKYFFGLTWIRQGRIGGCSRVRPGGGSDDLPQKKPPPRSVYARDQNVISKALKFDSKYQIRPGRALSIRPSHVTCPEIARVHFLGTLGRTGIVRQSAVSFNLEHFWPYFYFSSGYTWSSKYFFLIRSLRRILTTIRIRHIGFLVLTCNRRCFRLIIVLFNTNRFGLEILFYSTVAGIYLFKVEKRRNSRAQYSSN